MLTAVPPGGTASSVSQQRTSGRSPMHSSARSGTATPTQTASVLESSRPPKRACWDPSRSSSKRIMQLELLKSKIHRATVTDANLNYEGSITIARDLMDAAHILPYEKVGVLDVNNGNRIDTYVIEGPAGSGVICLNGAAARLVQPGDLVIIVAYATMSEDEAKSWKPTVIHVNAKNEIV